MTRGKGFPPAIMFQGTSSNAGKSVLAAGFCRMLLQDGFRPAPFKSQNMSLNSFVTLDNGEMGRAQVTQAQACGLEPDVRMNPVLLKPSSDVGSQVIIMGRPVGVMRVREYVDYKPEAFAAAREAYAELAEGHDVMVLEGAGSPAEVNLKAHDIVNMNMAAYAGATVLLVGDIDRGGVFAHLVGTMALLEAWERELVAGFVLNRFRGDPSLLDPALEITTRRTGKPFFGVVPHIPDLGLPEEDSVSFKQARPSKARNGEHIHVVLVDIPHISNFTDMDALAAEPDVWCGVAREARDLDTDPLPDAVILPGSKNTIQDLLHLRESGMAEAILALARSGRTEIVGICAGFQMLGERIADPLGLESGTPTVDGLGLLPLVTELAREKHLTRTTARHAASCLTLQGYEIHHGRTVLLEGAAASPCLVQEDGSILGHGSGLVWGSYLHGVFDDDRFRRWFVDGLRERKGLAPLDRVVAPYSIEPALDRLARTMREHLDWRSIYSLLGLPVGGK
jgi:adenosylcobyric acid synthase